MPRQTDSRFEFDIENAELKHEVERLQRENADLAKTILSLKRAGIKIPTTAEMYLLTFAVLVLGRMALYVFVEKNGTQAAVEAGPATSLFGAAAAVLLILWLRAEIRASSPWLAITKCTLIVVSLLVSASIFSNGKIWEGVATAPGGRPSLALGIVLGALFLAGSPLLRWVMDFLLGLITDPVGLFRSWRRKFYGR